MKKGLITLIIILGITFMVAGALLWIYPQQGMLHGWWLILIGAVFIAVTQLGEHLKGWRDFLFGERENSDSQRDGLRSVEVRRNWMIGNNKIKVRKNDSDVSDNSMLGANEIELENQRAKKKGGE